MYVLDMAIQVDASTHDAEIIVTCIPSFVDHYLRSSKSLLSVQLVHVISLCEYPIPRIIARKETNHQYEYGQGVWLSPFF